MYITKHSEHCAQSLVRAAEHTLTLRVFQRKVSTKLSRQRGTGTPPPNACVQGPKRPQDEGEQTQDCIPGLAQGGSAAPPATGGTARDPSADDVADMDQRPGRKRNTQLRA